MTKSAFLLKQKVKDVLIKTLGIDSNTIHNFEVQYSKSKNHGYISIDISPKISQDLINKTISDINTKLAVALEIEKATVIFSTHNTLVNPTPETSDNIHNPNKTSNQNGKHLGSNFEQNKRSPGNSRICKTILVSSAKGGVGKSTIAVNIAYAMSKDGYKTGLLDADVHGPSIPTLLGITNKEPFLRDDMIIPISVYGLKVMSIGLLAPAGAPIIWRGPMVSTAIRQCLTDVAWEDLDYLIIDMPPGTGDAQLSVAKYANITAATIVTTPHKLSWIDTLRGIEMYQKVNVRMLGVIENMSYVQCSECGHQDSIFKTSNFEKNIADRIKKSNIIARIPLDHDLSKSADDGEPIGSSNPQSSLARLFSKIARYLNANLIVI